jgi:hypothetical protein
VIPDAGARDTATRLWEAGASPTLERVLALAERSAIRLDLAPGTPHLELAGTTPVGGRPNRALVKVFCAGDGLWAAFFYKRSQIPSSRDRYAYGVVEFSPDGPDEADAEAWFRWLDAGFHPDLHPPGLKRAFTYTVPEG